MLYEELITFVEQTFEKPVTYREEGSFYLTYQDSHQRYGKVNVGVDFAAGNIYYWNSNGYLEGSAVVERLEDIQIFKQRLDAILNAPTTITPDLVELVNKTFRIQMLRQRNDEWHGWYDEERFQYLHSFSVHLESYNFPDTEPFHVTVYSNYGSSEQQYVVGVEFNHNNREQKLLQVKKELQDTLETNIKCMQNLLNHL